MANSHHNADSASFLPLSFRPRMPAGGYEDNLKISELPALGVDNSAPAIYVLASSACVGDHLDDLPKCSANAKPGLSGLSPTTAVNIG